MKFLRLELHSGIAGDMFLGLLLDLGANYELLRKTVKDILGKEGDLRAEKVLKTGLSATKATILFKGKPADEYNETSAENNFSSICELIKKAVMAEEVRQASLAVFEKLFLAEGIVHNKNFNEVHLHEAGAKDALGEICASAAAIRELGIEAIIHTLVPLARGTVSFSHGLFPNPAPATVELLKGKTVYGVEDSFELVTPTGAAMLSAWAVQDSGEPLKLLRAGYGAGTREDKKKPNALRGLLMEKEPASGRVSVIETNLDDCLPETIGFLIGRLMDRGALDVSVVPAVMKKNRPGHLIKIISEPHKTDELVRVLFSETGTLGIRTREENRLTLTRSAETVETEFGPVRVVRSPYGNKPEYEDCKKIAEEKNLPLETIRRAAMLK